MIWRHTVFEDHQSKSLSTFLQIKIELQLAPINYNEHILKHTQIYVFFLETQLYMPYQRHYSHKNQDFISCHHTINLAFHFLVTFYTHMIKPKMPQLGLIYIIFIVITSFVVTKELVNTQPISFHLLSQQMPLCHLHSTII